MSEKFTKEEFATLNPEEQKQVLDAGGEVDDKVRFTEEEFVTLSPEEQNEMNARPDVIVQKDISGVESAARGAAQGVSFGFADEVVGAVKAGGDVLEEVMSGNTTNPFADLSASYSKYKNEYRANDRAAEDLNPKSYIAGQVGGSVASTMLPGGVFAKLASNTWKAGTAAGVLQGIGASESETLGGIASDALVSGAVGGIGGKIASKIGTSTESMLAKNMVDKIQTLKQTFKLETKSAMSSFNKMWKRTSDNIETYTKDIVEHVDFTGHNIDTLPEAIGSKADEFWKTNVEGIFNQVDNGIPEGSIDVNVLMSKIQREIVKEFPIFGKEKLPDIIQNSSDTLSSEIGNKTHITLNHAQDLIKKIDVDWSRSLSGNMTGNDIRRIMSTNIRELQKGAADSYFRNDPVTRELSSNMMRVYGNLAESHKLAISAQVAADAAKTRLNNQGYSLFNKLGNLVTGSKIGTIGKLASKVLSSHADGSTNMSEMVSLKRMGIALEKHPGKYNGLINKVVNAAGRDVDEYIQSLGFLDATITLDDQPMNKNMQSVEANRGPITTILQEINPPVAEALNKAFEEGDEPTIRRIISTVSKLPEADRFFNDPNPGFTGSDGVRYLDTDLDKAEAKKLINDAPIRTIHKTLTNKSIDRGVLPPIPPMKPAVAPKLNEKPKRNGIKASNL